MSIHETSKVRIEPDGVVVKIIHNCSRCGGTHEHVKFSLLSNPAAAGDDGLVFRYWAMCPTLNQPIIMARANEVEI